MAFVRTNERPWRGWSIMGSCAAVANLDVRRKQNSKRTFFRMEATAILNTRPQLPLVLLLAASCAAVANVGVLKNRTKMPRVIIGNSCYFNSNTRHPELLLVLLLAATGCCWLCCLLLPAAVATCCWVLRPQHTSSDLIPGIRSIYSSSKGP